MGITPARLVSPTVGLMPTTPLWPAGHTIEPSVSVAMVAAARLAAAAAPEPDDEPHGLRSRTYGMLHWRPRPLQPLDEWVERKFAHSLRLVLPSRIAPACRKRAAVVESCCTGTLTRASEPAVVCIASAVSMLSLTMIGMPCSGERGPRRRRSASRS